nr:MAG TPA: hypothetical protein [Caudoviricetes sp.]DAI53924.1 MAG TPA: hypothetical protein [Caudoviricetes sp.]
MKQFLKECWPIIVISVATTLVCRLLIDWLPLKL